MKALLVILTSSVLAILAVVAQAQETTTRFSPATTLLGSRVIDLNGEPIGQIADFVLNKDSGAIAYAVLATRHGDRGKIVAVPWALFSPGSDDHSWVVGVDKEKIQSAPIWEKNRIEEYSRGDWIKNLYSYYGLLPPVGLGIEPNPNERARAIHEKNRIRNEERMREEERQPAGQTPNPDTLTQPPNPPR